MTKFMKTLTDRLMLSFQLLGYSLLGMTPPPAPKKRRSRKAK